LSCFSALTAISDFLDILKGVAHETDASDTLSEQKPHGSQEHQARKNIPPKTGKAAAKKRNMAAKVAKVDGGTSDSSCQIDLVNKDLSHEIRSDLEGSGLHGTPPTKDLGLLVKENKEHGELIPLLPNQATTATHILHGSLTSSYIWACQFIHPRAAQLHNQVSLLPTVVTIHDVRIVVIDGRRTFRADGNLCGNRSSNFRADLVPF
jgi:hypothetical protein